MRRLICVAVAVINLLFFDAATKEMAFKFLRGEMPISVWDGFFNLAYVENRGCAWGMFQGQVWPLAVFAAFALAFLIRRRRDIFVVYPTKKWATVLTIIAEPLLYAGIIGNLIDRVVRGYVIDFLDFHWYEAYHFPCFNLADTYISVAAAFLVITSFLNDEKKRTKNKGYIMKLVVSIFLTFAVTLVSVASNHDALKVAVYVDKGSKGIGAVEWVRLIDESPEMKLKLVDGALVRAGALKDQDVLVMPGGWSKEQTALLGSEGCQIVKDFIRNGGGYIGTCAGICVLMDEPKHRLNIIPYESVGSLGLLYSRFDINEKGAKMLGVRQGIHKMRYNGGPILKPTTNNIEGAKFEVWGTYAFEASDRGKVKKSLNMCGAPAIIGGTYGKGKVFGVVAHPEYYDSTYYIIQGAFKYVSGKDVTFPKRLHKRGAVNVGFHTDRMYGVKTAENILALANSKDVNLIAIDKNMVFRRNLDYIDVFVYTVSIADVPANKSHKALIEDFLSRGGKVVFVGKDASREVPGVVASAGGEELIKTILSL